MTNKVAKPTMKRKLGVDWFDRQMRVISMDTTSDVLDELRKYGRILDSRPYWLKVDSRFDFDEVLKFVQNYG